MSEPQSLNNSSQAEPSETDLGQAEPGSTALYDQSWLLSLLRPFMIALVVLCIDIALLAFLQRFVPTASGAYAQVVIFMGMVAAIIGCITTTWLAQPSQRLRRNAGYRAAEIVLILVITRVLIWTVSGTWPASMELLTVPLDTLLEGFIFGAIVVILSWIMATEMTSDLIELALQPDDLYTTRSFANRWQDNARPVYTDRGAILRRFVTRWVAGGVFLVILAASSQVAPSENGFFAITRQNIEPVVISAVIVYFLLGLALISQGQLAVLRARWTLQKTPSSRRVLRNWGFYALGLIGVMGALASLLPFGGTFRLAQIIIFLIQAIYSFLFSLFRAILVAFLLLMSLLSGEPPPDSLPEAPPPAPFMTPTPAPATSEFPAWAGGAVFWLIAALLLGYAAYIYFSGKGLNLIWLRQLWQMLRERWSLFFGAYQEWRMTHLHFASQRSQTKNKTSLQGLASWLHLRNLEPDQQVRYYYLSALHHAEKAGIPRGQSETPYNFAPRLTGRAAQTPDQEAAVNELTDAFVRVRYAGAAASKEHISQLSIFWRRVRDMLQKPVSAHKEQQ